MKVMDKVNNLMGTDTLKFAACGTKRHWQMKSELRSQCYTTQWKQLLKVK